MRFAYADPPYPGVAHRYPEKQEVDHAALIARLVEEFPDAWALSTKSNSLRDLLPLCPPKVRVGAWAKRYVPALKGVRPTYAWEPVIFYGGCFQREPITFDWCLAESTRGYQVLGQKPEQFSTWVFRLLGAQAGDEFCDLFPGSGAVTRAWLKFCGQLELPYGRPALR